MPSQGKKVSMDWKNGGIFGILLKVGKMPFADLDSLICVLESGNNDEQQVALSVSKVLLITHFTI